MDLSWFYYYSINVINVDVSPSDHTKRLALYYQFFLLTTFFGPIFVLYIHVTQVEKHFFSPNQLIRLTCPADHTCPFCCPTVMDIQVRARVQGGFSSRAANFVVREVGWYKAIGWAALYTGGTKGKPSWRQTTLKYSICRIWNIFCWIFGPAKLTNFHFILCYETGF